MARRDLQIASPPRWWQRRWFEVVTSLTLVACLGLVLAAEYVLHHAEPILRRRIIETLSARFNAPVELDRVDISLFRGIEVNAYGLRIPYPAGTTPVTPDHPMIAADHFAFRTSFRGLLRQPTHVALVRVDGLEIHVPPAGFRSETRNREADLDDPRLKPKIAIVVSELQCRNTRLFLESARPGPDHGHKPPLEFDIASLDLENVGRDQAMRYDAQLTNPKPAGEIHAAGHFGPWANGDPLGEPGQTPIDGDYSFDHADLSTFKGIGGTLSSRGHFAGALDRIAVDGESDTPNFFLDLSEHPLPLHTRFHAIVDGSNGDTYLQPVQARLASSDFTVSGDIVKVKDGGHDLRLQVEIPHGRMQDFLRLAVKTSPPLLNGQLTMHARLEIPPGPVRVPQKLLLSGTFSLTGVKFNNPKTQDRIDGLSVRAQGRPDEVAAVGNDRRPETRSQLSANLNISHGVLAVTDIHYTVPGALVLLNGVYSMDGKLFEFKGHVRTQATASQMVGGWKGLLLKPLDRFLEKNGAGVELPIEMTGTNGDVHFGLATHSANDTPAQMLADVKGKAKAKGEMSSARSEAAQADAEDAAAARAPTLDEAERLHAAAVRHRAEARTRALASEKDGGTAPPRPPR